MRFYFTLFILCLSIKVFRLNKNNSLINVQRKNYNLQEKILYYTNIDHRTMNETQNTIIEMKRLILKSLRYNGVFNNLLYSDRVIFGIRLNSTYNFRFMFKWSIYIQKVHLHTSVFSCP